MNAKQAAALADSQYDYADREILRSAAIGKYECYVDDPAKAIEDYYIDYLRGLGYECTREPAFQIHISWKHLSNPKSHKL